MSENGLSRSIRASSGVALALALIFAAVHAVAAGSASAATASHPADQVPTGFNNNAVYEGSLTAEQSADLQRAAGGDIDRVTIAWHALEPAPGEYRWGTYDAIYAADRARGIKPLFVLAYAPAWARAPGGPCGSAISGCHEPPAPEFYDEYAHAAAKIARRYPKAAGIEIWNEPNTSYFWRPRPDPAAYTQLLAQSYEAIKEARPRTQVVGGATAAGVGTMDAGKISGWEFLRSMYRSGANAHMDAIGVHAYPSDSALSVVSALPNVDLARKLRPQFDDRGTPIWVTETGITTTGPYAVSEATQATRLRQLDEGLRATPGVEMVIVHTLIEPNRSLSDPAFGYGVLTGALRMKAAYCQLALGWGLDPCLLG